MQEIMKGLPRGTFDRFAREQKADKHSKGFGCWDQLVAMVYAHLSCAEKAMNFCICWTPPRSP